MVRNRLHDRAYGRWVKDVTRFVEHLSFHGYDTQKIEKDIKKFPPRHGWDEQTETFVKLALNICFRDPRNGR